MGLRNQEYLWKRHPQHPTHFFQHHLPHPLILSRCQRSETRVYINGGFQLAEIAGLVVRLRGGREEIVEIFTARGDISAVFSTHATEVDKRWTSKIIGRYNALVDDFGGGLIGEGIQGNLL